MDPIGVCGVPDAIDEYDGDAGRVARRLREGAAQEGLAAYFEEHDFGIDPDPARDRMAARKVLECYERSIQRLEQPTAP